MKKLICFIILFSINISSYSQIQYALVLRNSQYQDNYDVILKNGAILSYALLMTKGDDWYQKNIIDICDEQSLSKFKFHANLYIDSFYVFNEYTSKMDGFIESLISAFDFMSKNKLPVFIESSTLSKDKTISKDIYLEDIKRFMNDRLCYAQECQKEAIFELNSNIKLSDYQFEQKIMYTKGKPIIKTLMNIFSVFPYQILTQNKNEQIKSKLSQLDWIKSQIDYYMNLHIDSSLDYGIDNSAFMIN